MNKNPNEMSEKGKKVKPFTNPKTFANPIRNQKPRSGAIKFVSEDSWSLFEQRKTYEQIQMNKSLDWDYIQEKLCEYSKQKEIEEHEPCDLSLSTSKKGIIVSKPKLLPKIHLDTAKDNSKRATYISNKTKRDKTGNDEDDGIDNTKKKKDKKSIKQSQQNYQREIMCMFCNCVFPKKLSQAGRNKHINECFIKKMNSNNK